LDRWPSRNIAGIFGVQFQRAILQIEAVHIKKPPVTQVHREQHLLREIGIKIGHLCAHVLERGIITDIAGIEIDAVDVEVFIAIAVLKIKQRAIVFRPEILANATLLSAVTILSCLDQRFHPNLKHVICVRSQPGEPFAIRRKARTRAFGISEQYLTRDQRGSSARTSAPPANGTRAANRKRNCLIWAE
jgi:hypothetical protein